MKQGEEALQKAISILSEQDGWTVETVAVSLQVTSQNNEFKTHVCVSFKVVTTVFFWHLPDSRVTT